MSSDAAASLLARLEADPEVLDGSLRTATDQHLSIGRDVWRLRWREQVTTAVTSDADLHTTCGALLDALAVAAAAATFAPDADGYVSTAVNLLVDRPPPGKQPSECDQALRSMRDAVAGPVARVWYYDGTEWTEDREPAPVWEADDPRLTMWVEHLLIPRLQAVPTVIAQAFLDAVDDPSLHLYPSEINASVGDRWAIRADGLQIGVAHADRIILAVGRSGADGTDGPQRQDFISVFGAPEVSVSVDPPPDCGYITIEEGAMHTRSLLRRWRAADVAGAPITYRAKGGLPFVDEHTVEARLLKGLLELDGSKPQLVADDSAVARGSQFPTLWGAGQTSCTRYLDAIVRRGAVPVLIELKVGTGGQGRYYRRAIVQAVLYRHFVLNAPALDPWFEAARLDRRRALAAIAVPLPTRWTADFARRHELLSRVAAQVGVEVHLVDSRETPERTPSALAHEPETPSRAEIEDLSWSLAAELGERWPDALGRVVERHGGGGQYDELILQARSDRTLATPSPGIRISLNRTGSVFVFSPTGTWRWVWRGIWEELTESGDVAWAADTLGGVAGLGPPSRTGKPVLATLAATFHAVVPEAGWRWQAAWPAPDGDADGVARWLERYRPAVYRYPRSGATTEDLPTVARLWGAVRDEEAAVLVDQDNLRVWVWDGGVVELTDPTPIERINRAALTLRGGTA